MLRRVADAHKDTQSIRIHGKYWEALIEEQDFLSGRLSNRWELA